MTVVYCQIQEPAVTVTLRRHNGTVTERPDPVTRTPSGVQGKVDGTKEETGQHTF